MAASWLRISELCSSFADTVCIVARVQSINLPQRMLILYDDNDDDDNNKKKNTVSSSTLNVTFANLRTSCDIQSSGEYVQIYGKVVRQGGDIIRVDTQFIRKLGTDFDMNEYIKGLLLTRNYMANIDDNGVTSEGSADNSGNAIRTIL